MVKKIKRKFIRRFFFLLIPSTERRVIWKKLFVCVYVCVRVKGIYLSESSAQKPGFDYWTTPICYCPYEAYLCFFDPMSHRYAFFDPRYRPRGFLEVLPSPKHKLLTLGYWPSSMFLWPQIWINSISRGFIFVQSQTFESEGFGQ